MVWMRACMQQQQESLVRGDSYRIPEFCPPWEHKMNPLLSEARIIAKYDWFIRYFGAKLDPRQVHKIDLQVKFKMTGNTTELNGMLNLLNIRGTKASVGTGMNHFVVQ